MSVSRQITLHCDECAVWTAGESASEGYHSNAESLRMEARLHGWRRVNGVDLCPECWEKSR